MSELQQIQSNIDKWAKISYVSLALYMLVILAGYGFEATSINSIFDPVLPWLLLFLFVQQKKSRVAAAVIVVTSVIEGVDYSLMLSGADPLFVGERITSDINMFYVGLHCILVLLGFVIGMETQRFHTSVESRISLRNSFLRILIAFIYVIPVIVLISFIPEPSEGIAAELFEILRSSAILAIIFLNMWCKLPGTSRFPTVEWGDEANKVSPSVSVGKSLMNIHRLANTQRTPDGRYIVSPGGILAKSYLLPAEQFSAYKGWHQRLFKVGWKSIFAFTVTAILVVIYNAKLEEYFSNLPLYIFVAMMLCLGIWMHVQSIKDFHKIFPEATITKRQGSVIKRIMFAIASAPLIGTNTYAIIAIFTGFLFLVPLLFLLSPEDSKYSFWSSMLSTLFGLWMFFFGTGIIYIRHNFKKEHNRDLTAKALAEVDNID